MRAVLLLVIIVSLTVYTADGGKKDKKKNIQNHFKSSELDNCVDDLNNNKEVSSVDVERKKNHRQKDKHVDKVKHKKEKFDHMEHLTWLNIKKDSDCGLKCKSGDVCITGPIDKKPLCVLSKDLKKSLKMFHRYQKKEMKAWKQFQKDYHRDNSLAEYFDNHHGKSHVDKTEMKKHYLQSQNIDHQKNVAKEKMEMNNPNIPAEAGDPEECNTSQFSQMRTRLMGWFHLLHGQDHFARKSHDGNIKHFYKHVSVKKELREHKGNKCECLKSAMWQFLQMDKDSNDQLNDTEVSILKDNSLEPCMQPYLTSCDLNADGKFSSNEWCCCFSNVVAPCFQKVDEIRKSGEPVTYMPRCDREGYFMREQCRGDTDKNYSCWCVDYNGNEFKGTSTNGRAHCSKISMYGKERPHIA